MPGAGTSRHVHALAKMAACVKSGLLQAFQSIGHQSHSKHNRELSLRFLHGEGMVSSFRRLRRRAGDQAQRTEVPSAAEGPGRENFATYLSHDVGDKGSGSAITGIAEGSFQWKMASRLRRTTTSQCACAEEILVLDKCYCEQSENTPAIKGKQADNVASMDSHPIS